MKRMIPIVVTILGVFAGAFAQSPDQAAIDKALRAAPGNLGKDATVIKWKADYTYDTLKKGTNNLVCYDKTGQPNLPAFIVECTSTGNLPRAAGCCNIIRFFLPTFFPIPLMARHGFIPCSPGFCFIYSISWGATRCFRGWGLRCVRE